MERATKSLLRIKVLAGDILSLLAFVPIPTQARSGQVKGAVNIRGTVPDTLVIIGGILLIIVALAGIGSSVLLYRHSGSIEKMVHSFTSGNMLNQSLQVL